MSSKFLTYGSSTDLKQLQDGTFSANFAECKLGNLIGSLPLRSNGSKKIVTGLIKTNGSGSWNIY